MRRVYPIVQLVALCASLYTAHAQKKQYTMAEATNGIATTLAPKSVKQPSWEPGTHNFYQVVNNSWVRFNADRGRVDTVLKLQNIFNDAQNNKPLETFPVMKWTGKDSFYFTNNVENLNMVWFTQNGKQSFKFLPSLENLIIEPTRQNMAITFDNNLRLGTGIDVERITRDTNRNIINGQAVHRNEFGIDRGIFFSPKGAYLAYYHMDQTMVEDYPVIDWSVTPAKAENVKYPMAGRTSHQVTVQVYNIATKQTTAIKTEGPKDQYLTCVTWSPDEKYIYIAILNRDQNHLWLNQYNAQTGQKVKTILQEQDDKYVEAPAPAFLSARQQQSIHLVEPARRLHAPLALRHRYK